MTCIISTVQFLFNEHRRCDEAGLPCSLDSLAAATGGGKRESEKRKKKSPERCEAIADGKRPWNEAASTTARVTFTRTAQMVAGTCRGGRLADVEGSVHILHCDSSTITSLHKQCCIVTVKQLPLAALKPKRSWSSGEGTAEAVTVGSDRDSALGVADGRRRAIAAASACAPHRGAG